VGLLVSIKRVFARASKADRGSRTGINRIKRSTRFLRAVAGREEGRRVWEKRAGEGDETREGCCTAFFSLFRCFLSLCFVHLSLFTFVSPTLTFHPSIPPPEITLSPTLTHNKYHPPKCCGCDTWQRLRGQLHISRTMFDQCNPFLPLAQ